MNRTSRHLLLLAPAVALALSAVAAFATSFAITRLALTFDDRKAATIVERDSRLTMQAEITFSGNGLLQATWEVAGPNPDGNNPQYRVLGHVQQSLAGRDMATAKSPHLPTSSAGVYLVRLRITEPATALELPVIRYNVNEKKVQQERP